MAARYWVGGTGTWDLVDTTHWSASSGGAGGASVPGAGDIPVLNAASGGGTVTLAQEVSVLSFEIGGFTGTFEWNFKITCTGNAGTIFNGGATYTLTGTKLLEATYAGATGTRTFVSQGTTETNAITLRVTAGTDSVAIGVSSRWGDIDFTGFAGTVLAGTRFTYGSLTCGSGMTWEAGTDALSFVATSGTKTITSNGKTLDFPITFNGVGGTFQLIDALTLGSSRALTLTNGTLDANNQNVSIGSFALGSGTKTLTLGSGTWSCAGNWNANTNVANLTVSASTGTISMTSGSSKTFSGGGKTWGTLTQAGAGALTITGANSFADITNTVNGTTVTLPASTTTTVAALSMHGAAGSQTTLQSSSAGSAATLSKTSGTVTLSYLSIKDIAFTGGATWRAPANQGNIDGGGNSGINFAPSGGPGGLSLGLGLRL